MLFVRRFTFDPGETILLEIESVNILDLDPPAEIVGVGTGTVIIAGEFENGVFDTPTEVASASDFLATFGDLGYTRNGSIANDPCARTRLADGAVVAEPWNGNGFVQLNAKRFARLLVVRVDTSVGTVQFTRLAYITGASTFRYDLEPSQVLQLDIGAGLVSATFTAVAAIVTAVGGTYPTTFAGGETLDLSYDESATFRTTFLAADQSNAQVVSRINAAAGFTFADLSGGQLRFTSRQKGTGAKVIVVAGSTGVLTQLGLTAATTAGTGNVANIDAVTPAEAKTVIEAAIVGTKVEQDSSGVLRISNTGVPGTGTILVGAATTATALGFTVAQSDTAAAGTAGTIPAGTTVKNTAGTRVFVTMQDVAVTAASAGPYTAKVRHATDDGTGLSSAAATVVVVSDVVEFDSFGVTNASLITAALTEAQIDAAYTRAIDTTLPANSISREANIIFSARQSNSVRAKLKDNAKRASANGLFGRMGIVRPPMNTLKAVAKSTSAEPGVGSYRDQRVIYTYPNAKTRVPRIASKGTAGGVGFTVDGVVNVGADGFLASVLSQLPPEENPGQENPYMDGVLGLEDSVNVVAFEMSDYTLFKAAGIAALRMSDGTPCFQSGVTSVDPGVTPQLVNISRRRMADFVQDSLARRAKGFGKKLSKQARRVALASEIRQFCRGLLSPNDVEQQRIAGFTVDTKQNTTASIGRGLFRITVKIKTLASLDSIVIAVTAGEQVVVEEELPLAA